MKRSKCYSCGQVRILYSREKYCEWCTPEKIFQAEKELAEMTREVKEWKQKTGQTESPKKHY